MRVEVVEECEHGRYRPHRSEGTATVGVLTQTFQTKCSGGSRRVLDLTEMVEAGAKAACNYSWGSDRWDEDVKSIWVGQAKAVLVAALGVGNEQ